MTRAQPASVREDDTPAVTQPTSRISRGPAFVYVALLFAVVLFFSVVRIRLRDMPLERDEGEYAYAGQLLLHGAAPYQHLYSVKLPGIYLAYAVMLSIFGESTAGIHAGLLVTCAASTLLLFLISRRLFGNLTALTAASSFALLSTGAPVLGLAGHATHFVVLFALAAILLLLQGLESGRHGLIFGAGLLFGCAFLMKQPGLVFTGWAAVYVVQQRWARAMTWRQLATRLGILLAGAALPYALTCALMLGSGEFRPFWFWTFSYVRTYGSAVPLGDGLKMLRYQAKAVVSAAPGIWLLAVAGMTSFAWSARARTQVFLATSLLLFSGAGVSAGLYFRPHYFILLLPAISMLVGLAIGCATKALSAQGKPALTAAPVLLFLVAFAHPLYVQRKFFFTMTPNEASRNTYGMNPFPEALEVGNYIRAHTAQDDTVAVLGSEPEIYFYGQRLSASPYIYMYPLLEPEDSAVEMQREMISQIEASRPAMLVRVNVPTSWIVYSKLGSMHTVLDWARAYIAANYVQDGVVEIGDPTEYVWGEAARNHVPRTRLSLLIFRRK